MRPRLGAITPIYNVYSGVLSLPPTLTAQQIVQPLPDATVTPGICDAGMGTSASVQCWISENPVLSLGILLLGVRLFARGMR